MGRVVELELPARPAYLALARLVVAAAATTEPLLGDDRLDDLRLAVSEACTNAIEAQAAADHDDDHIVVRCLVEDDHIQVLVQDRGRGFDLEALASHPPVTDPARLEFERGLGIPLIRILTDEVEFASSTEGTAVTMTLYAPFADGTR
ncbi:hypothetical protein BH20ACT2_BH20ACT2_22060 [soil metagenome]